MLSIIFTILFTIGSAFYDRSKRFEDHRLRWIFRVLVVVVLSCFNVELIILNSAIFYLGFDYMLNILEGREWNYIGTTSKIDKLWGKYGDKKSQLIFKISATILGIVINI